MTAIERLLLLTRVLRQAAGLTTKQLSWRLFGDSKKLDALERGADITVTRYEDAVRWLSDNWPPDTDWPSDVPRPDLYPPPSTPLSQPEQAA